MPIQVVGNSGKLVETDGSGNVVVRRGTSDFGTLGGSFVVSGGSSAVVAASTASGSVLASMRHGTSATTEARLTRLRVTISCSTNGVAGSVPGTLAWQRFTTATPSGGTARTPARKNLATGTGTQVADVRDNNAALTVTSVVFGDVISYMPIPIFIGGGSVEYVLDLEEDEVIRLGTGDGMCLRLASVTPATQTWMFTYTIHYLET